MPRNVGETQPPPLLLLAVVSVVVMMRVEALSGDEIKRLLSQNRTACLLVFGDSSVDPGNNNHLATTIKGNFSPYGKSFGKPTGRFTNGRLATDFIGEVLGCGKTTLPFLDPTLPTTPNHLLHSSISFASAGSGYDELTANLSKVVSLSSQLNYFRHYKLHLAKTLGYKEATRHIAKAAVVISMGSNDFLQNYFIEPTRAKQYSVDKYQNLLVSSMHNFTQAIYKLGARRLVLVGVPNIGCMPISIMIAGSGGDHKCVDKLNTVASSFNAKLVTELNQLGKSLKMKTAYGDVFGIIDKAVKNPKSYGFKEGAKGCCGTGSYEYGDTCKGLSTCGDPSKYIFWDAIHPSEKMYKIVSDGIIKSIPYDFFS